MKRQIKSDAAFTLVELLVSMALSLVALAAIYGVYKVQARTIGVQQNRQEAEDYARAVLDMMVREMRIAGYNPTETSSGLNCAGAPTAGTPGVVSATSTLFKFTSDYRGSASGSVSDGDCNDTDEEITYEYQSPGPQVCASGLGDIVRTANGTTEPITDCNVTGLTLQYYAKDSSTAMSPVVAVNIQRVKVTLTIQSKYPDAEFGGQLTSTVYSNVNLRNVGL